MKTWEGNVEAIVPAGGTGKRMGEPIPKQFLSIFNKPILIHTLEKLDGCSLIDNVIVAVPAKYISTVKKLINEWHIQKVNKVITGGRKRQESVSRALKVTGEDTSIILIHDAVRPFVSVTKIEETIHMARAEGASVLAVREKCTVKRAIDGIVSETVDRSDLWQIQTPQAFRADWLREGYKQAELDGFIGTDDAVLVERTDRPVFIVEGDDWNIKITTPEDIIIAEAVLTKLQTTNTG